jgi:hypothetical protein
MVGSLSGPLADCACPGHDLAAAASAYSLSTLQAACSMKRAGPQQDAGRGAFVVARAASAHRPWAVQRARSCT